MSLIIKIFVFTLNLITLYYEDSQSFMFFISLILVVRCCIMEPDLGSRSRKGWLKAFEGVEDERGHVHNVTHIKVEGNNYRFDMHTQDRDSSSADSDRQRQQVKGMVVNGKQY